MVTSDTWTPERVAQLDELVNQGLSPSEIARQMRLTKNSVIGRLHRQAKAQRERDATAAWLAEYEERQMSEQQPEQSAAASAAALDEKPAPGALEELPECGGGAGPKDEGAEDIDVAAVAAPPALASEPELEDKLRYLAALGRSRSFKRASVEAEIPIGTLWDWRRCDYCFERSYLERWG
jgi:hypothetical protein